MNKLKGDIQKYNRMHPLSLVREFSLYILGKRLAAITMIAAFFFLHSQTNYAASGSILQQLNHCAGIASNQSRLRCYDEITQTNDADADLSNQPLKSMAAADKVASTESPKTSFGEKYLEKKASKTQDITVALTLNKAYRNKRKLWVFEFTNGQIWQQLEIQYIKVPKALNTTATISSGIFGSYDLRVGANGRPIKVKRLK